MKKKERTDPPDSAMQSCKLSLGGTALNAPYGAEIFGLSCRFQKKMANSQRRGTDHAGTVLW